MLLVRLTATEAEGIGHAVREAQVLSYIAYMRDATSSGYYQNDNAVRPIADGIAEDGRYVVIDEQGDPSTDSTGMHYPYVSDRLLRGSTATACREGVPASPLPVWTASAFRRRA